MKKRILALMMTGVMLVGCPVMALAEEAAEETEVMEEGSEEIESLDSTMIDETVYEGTWISAFDVFDLYLPSNWDVLGAAEADSDFVPIAQNIVCSFSATAPEEETETE